MKNNIIAVYGAPESGKTTLSLKIAKTLSNDKKNVAVIFCDTIAPPLETSVKFKEKSVGSIGNILEANEIDQNLILRNCMFAEQNQYIGFLGYNLHQGVKTFAEYSSDRAEQFLQMLSRMVDHVIVDCTSDLQNDILSCSATKVANHVLMPLKCTLKSLSFFSTNEALIDEKKRTIVLNQVRKGQVSDSYVKAYKTALYQIPYLQDVEEQMESFGLLGSLEKDYEVLIKSVFKGDFFV